MTCATIPRTLQNKAKEETKINFYIVMEAAVLTNGSEAWTVRKQESERIQSAEMKFLMKTKRCILRYKIRNEDIRTRIKYIVE